MNTPPPYPGGFPAILDRLDKRRDPIRFHTGTMMPPADLDLALLARETVTDPATDPDEQDPRTTRYFLKRRALRTEFTGKSELCFWHGFVIACLRKAEFPDHFPALFARMWAQQADHLLTHLDLRWQVSAATTFADIGATPEQRSLGLGLSTLFATMKLYESERLFSGLTPDTPYPLNQRQSAPLPFQMDGIALKSGDVDVQLLGRLWRLAERDAVIGPLARNLLTCLINDPATVLARLGALRRQKSG